jgi:predicted GNAT superfamily acetyltransferase
MGAYVSTSDCQANYNVNVNCNVTYANGTQQVESFGGVTLGNFQGDADIAGVGVGHPQMSADLRKASLTR